MLARLLLLVAACLAAALPFAVQAQGTVVSIGGALRDDNEAVWRRTVDAAGGPGARFVVLAAASGDPDRSAAATIALLQRHGALAQHLRVAPRLDGIDLEAETRNPHWLAMVQQASGVYFTGGDQSRLVQTLAPGGQPTPLLLALRELLRRGGVVAGSSAGAAVMSEVMFTGGEPLQVLQGLAGQVHGPGLGFVRGGVLIDQHFLKRGRIGRLLPLMVQLKIPLGLGIDEDSAALIRGDEVEVIGARGMLVAELPGADGADTAGTAPFRLRGARLSFLGDGDRYNLASRVVTPSAQKRATRRVGPADPAWRPYFDGDHLFTEMLGDHTVVDAMVRLVDSRAAEVRGLAFDAGAPAGTARAELGFLWRLSRSAATDAWSVDDRYTVTGVQLDVQAVRMAQPLYRPWHGADGAPRPSGP